MNFKCEIKKITICSYALLFSFFLISLTLSAQNSLPNADYFNKNGGIQIHLLDDSGLAYLLDHKGITIDHGSRDSGILLYVNEEGFKFLQKEKIKFEAIPSRQFNATMKNSEDLLSLKNDGDCMPVMDFYPTYEAYIDMMYAFEERHPEICRIIELGTLASGRKILAARIGDNPEKLEDEPNFFYTSSMHGDEIAGFPIMLQLIDFLLCNYQENESVTNLVNEVNIFINPLANPNGTYRSGNHTVEGAIRYNSAFVDLNRNFPDPEDGPHPDGRTRQEETQFFMNFADSIPIQLACNIHGGVEVVNYPWDTYLRTHADDSWWMEVSRAYADTVQYYGPENYFSGFDNGITNGYAWYEVQGGRQDYMTYFKRAREMTLEISEVKLIDSDQLPVIWNANRNALLNYIEESLYGLRGTITDCFTGLAVKAEIYIPDHDMDNSSVFSDSISGHYFRYLNNGNYQVYVDAPGYKTQEFELSIEDQVSIRRDIELCPNEISSTSQNSFSDLSYFVNGRTIHLNNLPPENFIISVYDPSGRIIQSQNASPIFEIENVTTTGIYIIQLFNGIHQQTFSVLIK